MARKTKTVTCMNMILYCRMFILKCPSLQAALPWRKHQQLNHISEFRGILCMTSFLKPTSGNRDYRNIGRVTAIRCVGTETNLRPHFPYCSIDPGEVQWRNSRRYAVILDVMLLFSTLCCYSRCYAVILDVMLLFSTLCCWAFVGLVKSSARNACVFVLGVNGITFSRAPYKMYDFLEVNSGLVDSVYCCVTECTVCGGSFLYGVTRCWFLFFRNITSLSFLSCTMFPFTHSSSLWLITTFVKGGVKWKWRPRMYTSTTALHFKMWFWNQGNRLTGDPTACVWVCWELWESFYTWWTVRESSLFGSNVRESSSLCLNVRESS